MTATPHIFLIGHPGAGKMVLAKALSQKLGWDLVDLDFGLEHRFATSLQNSLGKDGSEQFYKHYHQLLQQCESQPFCIINCDPCIVDNPIVRAFFNDKFVVFVDVDLETQIFRYEQSIMPTMHKETFKNMLSSLHDQRDRHHERLATVSVNTAEGNLEQHTIKIVKALEPTSKRKISHKQRHQFHKDGQSSITLTDQQAQCLASLVSGKSSKEIARELKISYRTVEGHIANLQELLGCQNSKELINLYHTYNS